MPNLEPQSPLMQPILHNGHEYFTSQYFHAQYLANSPHGGKYRRHYHFLRAIRAIEAYELYVRQENIVELRYSEVDSRNPFWVSLFKSIAYNNMALLDATAQLALSHHLDDEVSKQMSVAANTMVARQSRRPAALLPIDIAERTMQGSLRIAALLGAPLHIAQQEAVKLVSKETGLDFRPLLQAAPAQDAIPLAERMLEPTDLAKELGWGENQGRKMNEALAGLGWQVKKIGGGWEATPTGKPHCVEGHAWTSRHSTKSGYNIKWRVAAVREALPELGISPRTGEWRNA